MINPPRTCKPVPASCLAILTVLTFAPACLAQPAFEAPIAAGFAGKPIELRGSGFGQPGPDSFLIVQSGTQRIEIPSTADRVRLWTDKRIVVRLPNNGRSGSVRMRTPAGESDDVRLEVFSYDWFDIPVTPGTNASPLSVALDESHRLWINQEFHLEFQMLDPAVGTVQGLSIPKPPNPGPFAATIFGDHRTQMSTLGEDIMVDPQGRIWFTQGGGYLYNGEFPNHSRIVCFDPDALPGEEYRVYNVPGDWNEVFGLTWDARRKLIWFTEGGLTSGAKIVAFDPEQMEWDNHFDFSRPLDHLVCPPGKPARDCYQVYELPNKTAQPAHLLVDADGFIWYTAFWGNEIGRLDPITGASDVFPLPKAIGLSDPALIVGSGPWQILLAPNGDIVFNEFFDSTIGRFRIARLGDPECLRLNGAGRNECIDELIVPQADLVNEQVHSIAFDPRGNLWFTQHGPKEEKSEASLGFVTADWKHIVRLPPLRLFPAENQFAGAGIAIDQTTGDIWFAEFWRQRIGRLQYRPSQ